MNVKKKIQQRVVKIIISSVKELPGILWVIGRNSKNIDFRLKAMADYIFEIAWRRKGIFFSRNRKGLAILIRQNKRIREKINLFVSMRFVLCCTGFMRAWEIFKRENYIHKKHPVDCDYLYFWLFVIIPSARGSQTALELKNVIFKESERLKLPIYLETTLLKNKRVYERFGFKVYHIWQVEKRNVTMYFMKREVLRINKLKE